MARSPNHTPPCPSPRPQRAFGIRDVDELDPHLLALLPSPRSRSTPPPSHPHALSAATTLLPLPPNPLTAASSFLQHHLSNPSNEFVLISDPATGLRCFRSEDADALSPSEVVGTTTVGRPVRDEMSAAHDPTGTRPDCQRLPARSPAPSPPDTQVPGRRPRPWIPTSTGRRARPALATGPPTTMRPSGTTTTPSPLDSEGQKGRAIEQMGRHPCCDKVGLKKGPCTAEEDQKLVVFLLTLLILLCVWMCLCGFGLICLLLLIYWSML